MITVGLLVIAGLSPRAAADVAAPLLDACARWHIETPIQQAAFVAQCWVESDGFSRLSENLNYTHAERLAQVFPHLRAAELDGLLWQPMLLANRVYSGRLGNGPMLPPERAAESDGWRYRGGGLIQLTGRANYTAMEQATGLPLVAQPDLLRAHPGAAASAAAFFVDRGCQDMATMGRIDAITRAINGPAMLRGAERRVLTARLRDVFTSA